MQRLQGGDASALADLFDRHSRPVYARSFVELGSRPDAEEITQDAFMLLWKKRKRIEVVGESVLPWLLVTVGYLSANMRRHRQRRMTEVLEEPHPASQVLDPALIVARGELQQVVERALERLAPPDRRIFQLCVVEGMSYKEAARHLNTSHAVVRNRLSRSRRSVRADLNAYLMEDER